MDVVLVVTHDSIVEIAEVCLLKQLLRSGILFRDYRKIGRYLDGYRVVAHEFLIELLNVVLLVLLFQLGRLILRLLIGALFAIHKLVASFFMLAVHHDHLKLLLAEGSTPSLGVDTSDGTGTLFVRRCTGSFHSSGSRGGCLGLRGTLFGQRECSVFTNCKLARKFHVLLLFFDDELGRSVSHCFNWHHLLPLLRGIPRRR
jgi:hypothetical protein